MLILDKNYFNKKRNIKNHLRDSFKNYNFAKKKETNIPVKKQLSRTRNAKSHGEIRETRDTMIIEKLADREFFCL